MCTVEQKISNGGPPPYRAPNGGPVSWPCPPYRASKMGSSTLSDKGPLVEKEMKRGPRQPINKLVSFFDSKSSVYFAFMLSICVFRHLTANNVNN